jgi:hypothetical protein
MASDEEWHDLSELTDDDLAQLYGDVIAEIADRTGSSEDQVMYELAHEFWTDYQRRKDDE